VAVESSDRDLARRFPSGDDDVLRDVYARFGGAVFTVAQSIVHDHARAADVVQATFLNAWRAAGTFDSRRELGPWLYTIARRQAVDSYRRERRLETVDPSDLDRSEALASGGDVDRSASLESTWEAWQVRLALDRLPPDEHELVHLAWFEGLTHVEIGERLGVPLGTVKSRSHRAHRRLAELLSPLRENQIPANDVESGGEEGARAGDSSRHDDEPVQEQQSGRAGR
jgi:RNA polymerase sigma-70 factor (ECF subfamily)